MLYKHFVDLVDQLYVILFSKRPFSLLYKQFVDLVDQLYVILFSKRPFSLLYKQFVDLVDQLYVILFSKRPFSLLYKQFVDLVDQLYVILFSKRPFSLLYKQFVELVDSLSELLIQVHNNFIATSILHDADSSNWAEMKEFYEVRSKIKKNCLFVISYLPRYFILTQNSLQPKNEILFYFVDPDKEILLA